MTTNSAPMHRASAATALRAVAIFGMLAVFAALAVLSIRALIRLDSGFDAVWYHLPFAAFRAGIPVPYDIARGDTSFLYLQGFPPLADLAQGSLWKLTGVITSVQLVNLLALMAFVGYCRWALGCAGWLVAMVALTAPLVAIHSTAGDVDL